MRMQWPMAVLKELGLTSSLYVCGHLLCKLATVHHIRAILRNCRQPFVQCSFSAMSFMSMNADGTTTDWSLQQGRPKHRSLCQQNDQHASAVNADLIAAGQPAAAACSMSR